MKRIRSFLPSPAMIVAVFALVAALSGTAMAGGFLPKKKFNQQALKGPLTYVQTSTIVSPTGSRGLDVLATCPGGFVVTGGGIEVSNTAVTFVQDSDPAGNTGWEGNVFNGGSLAHTAITTAICARSARVN